MTHPFSNFDALYDSGLDASETGEAKLRRPRFYNLLQIFQLADGVPGDTVEVGCFRGLSSWLMCNSMKARDPYFTGGSHTIVDSFEGLSVPAEEDELNKEMQGRFSDTSVEHVRQTLRGFPDVSIVKGWVPLAFESLPEKQYRFVHIDVDLYEPTRDCLDYFYSRVSPGGFLVVDDFGPWPMGGKYVGCPRAVIEFCTKNDVPFAALNTGNAVIAKRK